MIIPDNADERELFYADITQKCLVSREERKGDYDSWRSWYLFGNGPEEPPAQFNKILPHIETINSFMYSAETTRFSVDIGAAVDPREMVKVEPLTRAINDKWHDTDTDEVFGTALEWAHVYASMFVKLIIVKGGFQPYIIEPRFVGVLREDVSCTEKQEAMVHIYYMTQSDLRRRLYAHPKRDSIINRLQAAQHQPSEVPAAVDRIILSQSSPTMQGTVNLDLYGQNRMKAQVAEETIEMRELYCWNDETEDYQVVTIADPDVVIFDRPNEQMFLKGELPLRQICPHPMPDYYWGMSEVQKLISLQQLRNNRMGEILQLLRLQVKPPTVFSGFSGIIDEKKFAIDMEGSTLMSDIPNAKADRLAPQMPENLWKEIEEIDTMFAEASGISSIMQGQGAPGVRSAGQASQLARLGSSRVKKRALIVEDNLEKIATMYLRLMQAYDKTHYTDTEGRKFIADQFTHDFTVKVDAHSNSPIFMEDLRVLAFNLYKGEVIDKEMLVRLLQPPMEQMIIEKIKKLPPQQQMAPAPPPHKGRQKEMQVVAGGKSGE